MTNDAPKGTSNQQDELEDRLVDAGADGAAVAAYFDALRAFSGKAVGQAAVIQATTPDFGHRAVVRVMRENLGFPLHVRFVG